MRGTGQGEKIKRERGRKERKEKKKICYFFFNDTATTEIYTLSLHDALPIFVHGLHTWAIVIQIIKIGAIGHMLHAVPAGDLL